MKTTLAVTLIVIGVLDVIAGFTNWDRPYLQNISLVIGGFAAGAGCMLLL
jgi:hypothetical protein